MKINENTWVISDCHFTHKRCHTLFEPDRQKTAEGNGYTKFDEYMVNQWNSLIKYDDTVLFLGDFCINKRSEQRTVENVTNYTNRVNGNKVIIKGNHDLYDDDHYTELGWTVLKHPIIHTPIDTDEKVKLFKKHPTRFHFLVMKVCEKLVMFSHFPAIYNPMDERYDTERNSLIGIMKELQIDYNIHGHTHSRCLNKGKLLNVSVDNLKNYKPVKLGDLINTPQMVLKQLS